MKSTQVLQILPTIAKSLPEIQTPAGHLEIARARNVPLELVTVSSTVLQMARARFVEEQEREPVAASPAEDVFKLRSVKQDVFKPGILEQMPAQTADSQTFYRLWGEKS